MIKLITYCDDRMTTSAAKCIESAKLNGCDKVGIYGPHDLEDSFIRSMSNVLQHERGAGFYCWKPYVVAKEAAEMQDGDYLIWSDAGTKWINNVRLLLSVMQVENDSDSVLLFTNEHRHMDWCKMDCAYTILGGMRADKKVMALGMPDRDAKQVQASHVVFKLNEFSRQLIHDWLRWTVTPRCIDNEPSYLENEKTFQEHRWDQSILSCLQIQYGIPMHWFPSTMFMNAPNAGVEYPAMFEHHRKRNNEW